MHWTIADSAAGLKLSVLLYAMMEAHQLLRILAAALYMQFVLGRDIGQRLRRLHSCQRRLSSSAAALLEHCSSSKYPQQQQHTQLVLALVQQLVALNQAIAALTAIKDLRSPLLLRVMLRAGCVLLAPLLTGSWLAGLAYQATPPGQIAGAVGMVFGIVVGAIVSMPVILYPVHGTRVVAPVSNDVTRQMLIMLFTVQQQRALQQCYS